MKKILLVEDDLTLSKMLATWLGKQGYAVAVVSTVRQARKALEEDDVDLVLSDLRLPDADGTELLDWMKREQHLCPLIIMTGYADIHSAVTAMKLGAKDFISKPLQPDMLLQKIAEAMTPADTVPTVRATVKREAPPSEYMEGKSESARQLYAYLALVAPTPMSAHRASAAEGRSWPSTAVPYRAIWLRRNFSDT